MFAEMPLDSRTVNSRPLPPAQGFLTPVWNVATNKTI
jgi:hypothetical protein